MFAESEQRNAEAERQKAALPWEAVKRPIQLDLHMLAQKRMAAVRKG